MEWLNGALLLFVVAGVAGLIWRVKADADSRLDRLENGVKKETDDLWGVVRGCQSEHNVKQETVLREIGDLRTEVRTGFAKLETVIKNGGSK